MYSAPFTPEFEEETKTLQLQIKEATKHNIELKKQIESLESVCGTLDYALFAFKSKQWVLETTSREINSLMSYGEKIILGKEKGRRTLDPDTISKSLDEFQAEFHDREKGKKLVKELHEKVGSLEKVAKIISVVREMMYQVEHARDLLNLIDVSSPKQIEQYSAEMQASFAAFQDACRYSHSYLKNHHSDKLKKLKEAYQTSEKHVKISFRHEEMKKAILELTRFLRARKSAKKRLPPKPEFYEFHRMKKDGFSWHRIAEEKKLLSKEKKEIEIEKWERENPFTPEEIRLLQKSIRGSTKPEGRIPGKRYERRLRIELDLFQKYLSVFADLALKVSLNPLSAHSLTLSRLTIDPSDHAELLAVLDALIMGE